MNFAVFNAAFCHVKKHFSLYCRKFNDISVKRKNIFEIFLRVFYKRLIFNRF
jgi:hypothetical protein